MINGGRQKRCPFVCEKTLTFMSADIPPFDPQRLAIIGYSNVKIIILSLSSIVQSGLF